MGDLQSAKAVVRRMHDALFAGSAEAAAMALTAHTAPDWHWRGVHPFGERRGAQAVAETFWTPLMTAFARPQRRPDIFMAGLNEIDGFESIWVVEMGHLLGLFDRPWLGIRPTRRLAMLRYVEFHHVIGEQITETAMFCDVLDLLRQAGQWPLPPPTGAHLVQPGPRTHNGLLHGPQNEATGRETLRIINAMLHQMGEAAEDYAAQLARSWHDGMVWWGPAGIGASFTILRYIDQHCRPFHDALHHGYRFNGHLCRLAEGTYGGFFGWPNLTVRNAGGFLGMPAGPGPADMRVVDLYRVEDGRLAENWIFIDLLHLLAQQGLDVLGRAEGLV